MKIDARDVLDPDAIARRSFRAQVMGHFRRTGPNPWDAYAYVRQQDGESVEVLPGIKLQQERFGAQVRMRRNGRVVRLRWMPQADEQPRVDRMSHAERREYFVGTYLTPFDELAGAGAAAVIAGKLDDRGP